MDTQIAVELAELSYMKGKKRVTSICLQKGFKEVEFIRTNDTEIFIANNDVDICVVFRGTSNLEDFRTDIFARKRMFRFGKVHMGFALAYFQVSDKLAEILRKHKSKRIFFIGHSLGGALANIACKDTGITSPLKHPRSIGHDPSTGIRPNVSLITFGSPRVGNKEFSRELFDHASVILRYVNNNDIVPRIPKINYFHAGPRIYINRHGVEYAGPEKLYVFADRVISYIKHIHLSVFLVIGTKNKLSDFKWLLKKMVTRSNGEFRKSVKGFFKKIMPDGLSDHFLIEYKKKIKRKEL